jgi:hypothetical protein
MVLEEEEWVRRKKKGMGGISVVSDKQKYCLGDGNGVGRTRMMAEKGNCVGGTGIVEVLRDLLIGVWRGNDIWDWN